MPVPSKIRCMWSLSNVIKALEMRERTYGGFRIKISSLRLGTTFCAQDIVRTEQTVAPGMLSEWVNPKVLAYKAETEKSTALFSTSECVKGDCGCGRKALEVMLQPPRGREVSFYEWEGRGKEGDGTAQMPQLPPPPFVNGRAERLRRAETRRLHFYEWGGLRVLVRRRDVQIFMNGVKMGNERVGANAMRGKGRQVFWSQGQCQD